MCRNVSHRTVIVGRTTKKRSLRACVWSARGRRCPRSSSVASRLYLSICMDVVATGSALKGQPQMGIPLRCCCSLVRGILRARWALSFAGPADSATQRRVDMEDGVGAFSEAMRALSYRLGALPVIPDDHGRRSSYTNMLCTRSGLELAWSTARAAAGGDFVRGRGRPLTRWRPPTVQSNAQSSARELENAS